MGEYGKNMRHSFQKVRTAENFNSNFPPFYFLGPPPEKHLRGHARKDLTTQAPPTCIPTASHCVKTSPCLRNKRKKRTLLVLPLKSPRITPKMFKKSSSRSCRKPHHLMKTNLK